MKTLDPIFNEIRQEWLEHILPFWSRLKDEPNGGYYGEVDSSLSIKPRAPKGSIANSRILWSFAAAYRVTGIEDYRKCARHAFSFLTERLLDPEFGGLIWMADYQGNPLDARKHVYNQAFGVYALSEFFRATGEPDALKLAQELFKTIETVGYDEQIGAYREEFDREWNEQPNEMLSGNGVVADITMNTHIHVLEAYTTLYRIWPDPQVRQSLDRLLAILHDRMFDPELGRLNVFFDKNWASLADVTSFGHDIEASWLIQDAIEAAELSNPNYKQMVLALAHSVSERAIQSDGSVMNEEEGGRLDTTRIWWVQAEAMVGFLNAYELTAEARFLELVRRIWSYTSEKLIDPRPGGEWYWSVDGQGNPDGREIAGPWKCPYHNSRFCIEMLLRMERLHLEA